MYSKDDKLKNELKHECELPPEEDIIVRYIYSGPCVELRRNVRRMFLLNASNPHARIFLRSAYVIERERRRHLDFHYYMIHPFSTFRIYWEIFMMFIFFQVFITMPILMIIHEGYFNDFRLALDVFCLADVALAFNTGYMDAKTNNVVLDRWKVARHYFFGWFIVDVISSVTWISWLSIFDHQYSRYEYLSFLRILRLTTFLRYIDQYRDHRQLSVFRVKLLKLIFIITLVLLWVGCTWYHLMSLINQQWLQYSSVKRWVLAYRDSISLLLQFGTLEHNLTYMCVLMEIIFMSVGFMLQMLVISQILQIVTRYSGTINKYHQMTQQVNEFMRYKNLPGHQRARIQMYFDFRFQQNYYKEREILNMLSPQLRQEMLIHSYMHLLEKVSLFDDLPMQLLYKIISAMRIEVYLPSDVIVTAGTIGDSMYFISSGTVAVYTSTGKEMCHLVDGSHFGEIALIMESEYRVATVVAIDCCEVFILQRKDFRTKLEQYPEVLNRMRKIAQERLRKNLIVGKNGAEEVTFDIMSSDSMAFVPRKTRSYSII